MAYDITENNKNSSLNKNSRYVQGGITDIYNKRLGWWERKIFTKQQDDYIYEIGDTEVGRPDLISYNAYGKSTYAWLVLQYNNIVDPIVELTAGKTIFLPTQFRLITAIITRSEGGNKI